MKRMLLQDKSWVPEGVPNSHLLYLWDIAWKFHKHNGHDVEDLFSEACLKYCLCRNNWQGQRGKFSTFLYTVVTNHLRDYVYQIRGNGCKITVDGNPVEIQFVPYEHVEQLLIAAEEAGVDPVFENFSV